MSGEIGVLPRKRELAPGGMEAEAKQTLENIGAVVKANGLTFDDVFKCTAMLADMSKWGDFNKIYVTHFKPEGLPARSALGANGLAWVRKWSWNVGRLSANNGHDGDFRLALGGSATSMFCHIKVIVS